MRRQPKSLNDRFEDEGHVSIEYGAKWQRLQHLIMYGILQMHPTMFDALENTARTVGSRKEAYVGIQVRLSRRLHAETVDTSRDIDDRCRDIFQLPPGSADVAVLDYAFSHTLWGATFSGRLRGDFLGLLRTERGGTVGLVDECWALTVARRTCGHAGSAANRKAACKGNSSSAGESVDPTRLKRSQGTQFDTKLEIRQT
ncbi:hypothetical protein RHS01_00025 [Rhizoctonia solani]|uniref:Uncharacterized protein n=1 Tax=Rhizoctonia solani TaxID=456999 RepID=A0A8H7INM9_9AGAM|nr:hypothetical protein RHS01_00025 [Rhizoctonia solani]